MILTMLVRQKTNKQTNKQTNNKKETLLQTRCDVPVLFSDSVNGMANRAAKKDRQSINKEHILFCF